MPAWKFMLRIKIIFKATVLQRLLFHFSVSRSCLRTLGPQLCTWPCKVYWTCLPLAFSLAWSSIVGTPFLGLFLSTRDKNFDSSQKSCYKYSIVRRRKDLERQGPQRSSGDCIEPSWDLWQKMLHFSSRHHSLHCKDWRRRCCKGGSNRKGEMLVRYV